MPWVSVSCHSLLQPTWLQGWDVVSHCHKARSYLGSCCCECYRDGWKRAVAKVLGIMDHGGEHCGEALLDLGWEMRQWPFQLVLSMNKTIVLYKEAKRNLSLRLPWLWHWAGIASPRAHPPARRSQSPKMACPHPLKRLLWCPVTHGPLWPAGFCSLQVSGWEVGVFRGAYNRKLALTSTTERLTPFQNDIVHFF